MKTHAFCSACMVVEAIDQNWRALRIASDGSLRISPASQDLAFNDPDTVFACGEGSTLILVERYLQSKSFLPPHEAEAELAANAYPELT